MFGGQLFDLAVAIYSRFIRFCIFFLNLCCCRGITERVMKDVNKYRNKVKKKHIHWFSLYAENDTNYTFDDFIENKSNVQRILHIICLHHTHDIISFSWHRIRMSVCVFFICFSFLNFYFVQSPIRLCDFTRLCPNDFEHVRVWTEWINRTNKLDERYRVNV